MRQKKKEKKENEDSLHQGTYRAKCCVITCPPCPVLLRQPCSGVRQVTPRLAKRPRPHWRAHMIAQGKKDPAVNARACAADWPRLAQVVCIPSVNPTFSSMQPAYVIGREKFQPSPPSCCVITVSLFGLPHCTVRVICKLCGRG